MKKTSEFKFVNSLKSQEIISKYIEKDIKDVLLKWHRDVNDMMENKGSVKIISTPNDDKGLFRATYDNSIQTSSPWITFNTDINLDDLGD